MVESAKSIEVEYPESDGEPMGETDLHRDLMIRLIELFKERYRDQHVYVSGNLLLYYEEGVPYKHVSPDAFVVLDKDPGRRRVYKTWEEGAPNVVFEVTSSSTKRRDEGVKPQVYAAIGVREYFLFDPTSDYLLPPLQGFRLDGDAYEPIPLNEDGRLDCRELGVTLAREAGELVLRDAVTGEVLLERWEAEQRQVEKERRAREVAEAEIDRLKRLLGEDDSSSTGD